MRRYKVAFTGEWENDPIVLKFFKTTQVQAEIYDHGDKVVLFAVTSWGQRVEFMEECDDFENHSGTTLTELPSGTTIFKRRAFKGSPNYFFTYKRLVQE